MDWEGRGEWDYCSPYEGRGKKNESTTNTKLTKMNYN